MSMKQSPAWAWRRGVGIGVCAAWFAGAALAAERASAPLGPAVDQAQAWLQQNRLEPAIERLEALLVQHRTTDDPVPSNRATLVELGRAWGLLAEAYGRRGQFALQHRALVHEVDLGLATFGPNHPVVLATRTRLALSLRDLQHPREAETELRAVIATRLGLSPIDAAAVAQDQLRLAIIFLVPQRRLAEAEEAVSGAMRRLQQAPGFQETQLTPLRTEMAAIQTAQGRPADAESVLRRVLAFIETQGAAASPQERLQALEQLGLAQLRQGHYAAAEQTMRSAVQVASRHPGYREADLNLARTRLSEILVFQARPAEAVPLVRAVLDSQRQGVRGEFHPSLSATYSRLAKLLIQLDRGQEAVTLLSRLVEETRTFRGARHAATAEAMATLAWAQQSAGRYAQAEQTLLAALDIEAEATGRTSEPFIDMRNQLGTLRLAQGRFAEAADEFRVALQATQARLGPTDPEVATVQANLAQALQRQGRLADAAAVLRQALAVREARLGPVHHLLVDTLDSLGSLYSEMEDLPQAEAHLSRAIEMRRQLVTDPKDVRRAGLQGALAAVWIQANKLPEAEAVLRESIATLEAADPHDAALPNQLVNLGGVHRRRGEFAQAQSLMERALRQRRETWGPDTVPTANVEVALARVLDAAGQPRAAESLLNHALKVLDQGQTRGTPYVAVARMRLAEVYSHTERPALARTTAQAALSLYERTYGLQHPDTVACRNLLATLTTGR